MTRIQLQIHDSANEMNPLTGLPEMSVLNDHFEIEWVNENPEHVFTILRTPSHLLYGLDDDFRNHHFGSGAIIDNLLNRFLDFDIEPKIGYIVWNQEWWENGYLPLEWISEEPAEYLVRCTYQEFKNKCEDWS